MTRSIHDHTETIPDSRNELRELVNLLLPDSLMIALAVVMIPVVLVPIFVTLPAEVEVVFTALDSIILGVFVVEYLSKLFLAPDILKHFLDPWHLLDLLIILVPAVNLLPFLSSELGSSSLLLRLLRIIRVVAVGGRTVDRRAQIVAHTRVDKTVKVPMSIQIMDGKLSTRRDNVPIDQLGGYLDSPVPTWADISCVSEADLEQLSAILHIPRILLKGELLVESYPRVDYFDKYSMIFTRMVDIQPSPKSPASLSVNRTGLLVICHGQNIITLSKAKTNLFHQIIEKAREVHNPDDPVVVTVLYTILKYILEQDKWIIGAVEHALMGLESTPLKKRPSNFLETTFHLRKEITPLVPSLLHMKEVLSVITSKRVPLAGFDERNEKIFNILVDEAGYLLETASDARDNLQSLVDLYINTTSFETNKVMRIIAVITSLGIIPALMGLLGSNIAGNPWDIQLWQLLLLVGTLMLALGWIFLRLGWLKP